jgi:hypothetical protein
VRYVHFSLLERERYVEHLVTEELRSGDGRKLRRPSS